MKERIVEREGREDVVEIEKKAEKAKRATARQLVRSQPRPLHIKTTHLQTVSIDYSHCLSTAVAPSRRHQERIRVAECAADSIPDDLFYRCVQKSLLTTHHDSKKGPATGMSVPRISFGVILFAIARFEADQFFRRWSRLVRTALLLYLRSPGTMADITHLRFIGIIRPLRVCAAGLALVSRLS